MSGNIPSNQNTVEIVEIGPRDGLQNEQAIVDTANKIRLIEKSIGSGSRRIEVASFVNPRRVPQMADADEVCAALPDRDDVTYIGLVINFDKLIASSDWLSGIMGKKLPGLVAIAPAFPQQIQ
jgi:isopropylmalate/homocitrate/citramalate synthase